MVSIVGEQGSEGDIVEQAVALEHDCVAAYTQALGQLRDAALRRGIEGLIVDHRARLPRLQERLRQLSLPEAGRNPVTHVLNRGKVELSALLGRDRAIIAAITNNADDTALAYGQVAARVELSAPTRALFADFQQEAQRHQTWFASLPAAG